MIPFATFGTNGDSLNLMDKAWKKMKHVFMVQNPTLSSSFKHTQNTVLVPGPNCPLDQLDKYPVDLLFIKTGQWQCPKSPPGSHWWEHLITHTPRSQHPKLVVEVLPPNSLL